MSLKFSTYSLTLFFIFMLFTFLYKTQLGRKSKCFIFMGTVTLALLAFLFDPVTAWEKNGNYTDLYRFYRDMDAFREYGWNGAAFYFQTAYNNIPVIKMLVFCVAKSGVYGLLAAMSAALVYGLTANTLTRERCHFLLDDRSIVMAFMVFVALTNYKVMITNVRMPIGMALFFLLSYLDLVEGKRNLFLALGYICLPAIHSIFLVFLLLRLLLQFSNRYSMKAILLMAIFSGSLLSVFSRILELFSSKSYIANILYKIDFYTRGDKAAYFETPIVVLGLIKVLLIVFLLQFYRKRMEKILKLRKMYDFSCIFTAFSIGSIWNYYLFMRTTNYLCFLVAFWTALLFYQRRQTRKTKQMTFSLGEFFVLLATIAHLGYYFLSYQYRVLCF